jgi:hypothetical protein
MAVTEKEKVETLERGNIYFFYRPRVEEEEPESLEDVQRFYLVLSPEEEERFRLVVIGSKRLPEAERKGQRFWGFIDLVRNSSNSIREELSGEKYRTKTRGERHVPAARPAGEGVYRLLRHGSHTHLVYALELPEQPGEVQEELRIEPEGSFVISIKNPETPSPRGAGLRPSHSATFPRHLMEVFHGRRFAAVDPPAFLDKEGAEFVLIAAAEDIEEELGITLDPEEESANRADIFTELKIDRGKQPLRPLFEGKWD